MADIGDIFIELVMEEVPNMAEYIDGIASAVEANWKEAARQQLHTARKDYVNAIVKQPMQVIGDDISITIELTADESPGSWLPNLLEQGHAPYDLKDAILKNKDHQIIFMRKGTPAALNLLRMTTEQHKIMKSLKPDRPIPNFMTEGRSRSDKMGYGVHYSKSKPKTDITQGMQKMVRNNSTTYGTFRTVSRKSKAPWKHPGFTALNLAEQVVEKMGL
jgi:hypothetical protein